MQWFINMIKGTVETSLSIKSMIDGGLFLDLLLAYFKTRYYAIYFVEGEELVKINYKLVGYTGLCDLHFHINLSSMY